MGTSGRILIVLSVTSFFAQIIVANGQARFRPQFPTPAHATTKTTSTPPTTTSTTTVESTEVFTPESLTVTLEDTTAPVPDATDPSSPSTTNETSPSTAATTPLDTTNSQTTTRTATQSLTTLSAYNLSQLISGEVLVEESPSVAAARTQVMVCLMMESGPKLWYDYDKSSAALDLALSFVNQNILADIGLHFDTTFQNTAHSCAYKNHAVTYALELIDKGIHCDVYIGGGELMCARLKSWTLFSMIEVTL